MSAWLSKWAPASGVLAGVLVAIAFFAGPNSPGDDATGAQVIAWYQNHHTADFVFDLIGGLAVMFLVLFAVALARQVRTGDRWLAHGALAGAVFGGVAFLTSMGFDTVLAQDHSRLTIASAQTLNLLQNDLFLPIVVGFALFGILTGLAVVVGRILPKWLGEDKLYGHVKPRKTRTRFLEFCRYLCSLYPPATRIAIICDNFSPHLSTAKDGRAGAWAAAINVEIACTPANSSWLNRIEAQFTACGTSRLMAATTPATKNRPA